MTDEYWDLVRPTYIENWPKGLAGLSIEQIDVPMTLAEAHALGTNIMEYAETFGLRESIDDLRHRVAGAVAKFPRGAFVRLGSRSPKDTPKFHYGKKILTYNNPLHLLTEGSERISDDLHLAIHHQYAPHIFVRKWLDFTPWQEFRCFQKDHRLVGISQYHYLGRTHFQEIHRFLRPIKDAIVILHEVFRDVCPIADVVFDVIVEAWKGYTGDKAVATFLEINPFSPHTDPCLFDWGHGGSFRGEFLVVGDHGQTVNLSNFPEIPDR